MKKFLSLLMMALLCVTTAWAETVTDVLTRATTGITSTSYDFWTASQLAGNDDIQSSATYIGKSAGGNDAIQLRSKNSDSGIVTSVSGGKVKSITLSWNNNTSNGQTLCVYGKTSSYTNAADLYNTATQGTSLGDIIYGTSTTLTINGDYQYIGLRSKSGALYLNSITIEWETGGTPAPTYTVNCTTNIDHGSISANFESAAEGTLVTITGSPEDGYKLGSVTVTPETNGVAAPTATVNGNTATFAMPASNVTVTAEFVESHSTTYKLVKDPKDLVAKAKYILSGGPSGSPYSVLLGAVSNDIGTVVSDGFAYDPVAETMTVEDGCAATPLTLGGETGAWTFHNGTAYLALTAEDNKLFAVGEATANNAKWSIDQTYLASGAHKYLIANNGYTTTRYIEYNTGNNNTTPRFACYKGTMQAVALFKLDETASNINIDENIEHGEVTYSINNGVVTLTVTPDPGYELATLMVGEEDVTDDVENNSYSFDMPEEDVTVTANFTPIEYNINRIITAQNPHDQGGWLGNWSTNCTVGTDWQTNPAYSVTALADETVQFEAGPNAGYMILPENITIKDANNNDVEVTPVPNENNKFQFTMPASDVTITADFTFYRSTLRLAGHFNNHNNWITGTDGPSFNYAYKDENNNVVDKYSIRAFFTGIDDDGYNDYFFVTADGGDKHPSANGNWGVTNTDGTPVGLTWYGGSGNNFRIAPGVYDIEIAGDLSTIAFTKLEPTIAFNPDAAEVESGTSVSATSTLTGIINAIQTADPVAAQGEVAVQVSTDNYTFSPSVMLTNFGSNHVYGKASIGNIVVTGNTTYNVVAPNISTQYELIKSADKLVAGKKYIIVSEGSYTVNSNVINYKDAAGALNNDDRLDAIHVDIVEADGGKVIDLASVNGVTEFTLGGNATNGWTFAFSDGTKLASELEKNVIANATGTPATISFSGDNATIYMNSTVGSLQHNNNSNGGFFATYKSSQRPVMLFKQVEGTPTQYSATPEITPESGEIVGLTQEVTINGTGTIYYTYTTDGNDPVNPNTDGTVPADPEDPTQVWTEYTAPFTVGNATTPGQVIKIKAIAKEENKEWSAVTPVTRYLFVAPDRPVFSHAAGTYDMPQSISLSTRTEGADIYYTTDGSLTNTQIAGDQNNKYNNEPIPVSGQVTFYAVSAKNGAVSSIVSAAYNCEAGATLEQIEENGVVDMSYTVSNDLQIVAISYGESVAFARDLTTTYVECPEEATDFMVDVVHNANDHQDGPWQKNNWVMLDFKPIDAEAFTALLKDKENFIIQGGTLTGVYTDKNNYTIKVTSTPTLKACGDENTYKPYKPNVYSPANFQVDEYGYQNGLVYEVDEDGNVDYNSEPIEVPYWFKTPQVMEVCKITWAMWYDKNGYAPGFYMQDGKSGLKGGISADFDYNNVANVTPTDGASYRFTGVIMKATRGTKAVDTDPTHHDPQDGSELNEEFKVAAVDFDPDPENGQVITGVSEVKTGGDVVSVTYCDLAGRMSQKPFAGVNIIVTRYSDGTVKTTKAIK